MKRDLKRLSSEMYDLLVIGAGIYGATVAWEASLRGLKVALIDRGDFGSATSANSLKTIHGGLRYLQQFDIRRMRESIRERRIMMYIAPHLVHPLPVLMPTYSFKLKSRPALMMALLVNDIVGFDCNSLADPQKYLPHGRTISGGKLKEMIPGYDKYNLNGGALWYDCQCYNTERLLLSFIISAISKGADAANYVKATNLLRESNKVIGVKAQDIITGNVFDIRANYVVNESGAWVDEVLAGVNGVKTKKRFLHSTAMNLIVNRDIAKQYALGLSGTFTHVFDDGSVYNGFRILFLSPWRGRTIIGTDHRPYYCNPDKYQVTENQIQNFIDDINKAYPSAEIKREEVTFINSGFLPMTGLHPKTGEIQLVRHYRIHDHAREDGIEGLLTVIGVKYTTARDVAKKTVDLVARRLERSLAPHRTDTVRLYGGEIEKFTEFVNDYVARKPLGLDEKVIRHLCYNYGSSLNDILMYAIQDRYLLEKIAGSDEILKAEVLHAVREEMAQTLDDVILRRTDLGSAGHPGTKALQDTASLMAQQLGWNNSRMNEEINKVNAFFTSFAKQSEAIPDGI